MGHFLSLIELVTHKLHTLNINTQKVTTVTVKNLFSKEKYTFQNRGKHVKVQTRSCANLDHDFKRVH